MFWCGLSFLLQCSLTLAIIEGPLLLPTIKNNVLQRINTALLHITFSCGKKKNTVQYASRLIRLYEYVCVQGH